MPINEFYSKEMLVRIMLYSVAAGKNISGELKIMSVFRMVNLRMAKEKENKS